jgi:hypothetical protein
MFFVSGYPRRFFERLLVNPCFNAAIFDQKIFLEFTLDCLGKEYAHTILRNTGRGLEIFFMGVILRLYLIKHFYHAYLLHL